MGLLSRLRKLEDLTDQTFDDMPINYDIESDALYQRGIQKGIIEGKEIEAEKSLKKIKESILNIVENMLNADVPIDSIALFTNLSIEEIEQIKKDWEQRSNTKD